MPPMQVPTGGKTNGTKCSGTLPRRMDTPRENPTKDVESQHKTNIKNQ